MYAESDNEEFWDGVKPIPKLLVVKTQAKSLALYGTDCNPHFFETESKLFEGTGS